MTAAPRPASRCVLVTGASSGIGRAVAHQLSGRGHHVVLVSRSRESLERVAEECRSRGAGSATVLPADVSDRDAVADAVGRAVDVTGRLDGVVHAAAVLAYGRFTQVPPEVFDRIVDVNIVGAANVSRSALQVFEDQGHGSLVVVGSVLGKVVTTLMSPYCATKWAVTGMVRVLQLEARRTPGVKVSLVSPGSVNTPIYDLAGSYTGHRGAPPPVVAPPERVARRVVAALDRPVRDRRAGLLNPVMVAGFRWLPAVYDVLVGPLMDRLGQRDGVVPAGPGNVFEPSPEQEALRGRWNRPWG